MSHGRPGGSSENWGVTWTSRGSSDFRISGFPEKAIHRARNFDKDFDTDLDRDFDRDLIRDSDRDFDWDLGGFGKSGGESGEKSGEDLGGFGESLASLWRGFGRLLAHFLVFFGAWRG